MTPPKAPGTGSSAGKRAAPKKPAAPRAKPSAQPAARKSKRGGLDILMVTPEARPFAKTGGLADVCGALPRALFQSGKQLIHPGEVARIPAAAAPVRAERQVLRHVEIREDAPALRHMRNPGARHFMRGKSDDALPLRHHAAGARRNEP